MAQNIFSYEAQLARTTDSLDYHTIVVLSSTKLPPPMSVPTALIYPSTLVECSAKARGRMTTKVEFLLAKYAYQLTPDEKLQMLAEMRVDVLRVLADLEQSNNVVEISDINMELDSRTMSDADTLALRVEATVLSNFIIDSQVYQMI